MDGGSKTKGVQHFEGGGSAENFDNSTGLPPGYYWVGSGESGSMERIPLPTYPDQYDIAKDPNLLPGGWAYNQDYNPIILNAPTGGGGSVDAGYDPQFQAGPMELTGYNRYLGNQMVGVYDTSGKYLYSYDQGGDGLGALGFILIVGAAVLGAPYIAELIGGFGAPTVGSALTEMGVAELAGSMSAEALATAATELTVASASPTVAAMTEAAMTEAAKFTFSNLVSNPGLTIGQALGITNPIAAQFVGNTIVNTAMNGGDIEAAAKGAIISTGIGVAADKLAPALTTALKDVDLPPAVKEAVVKGTTNAAKAVATAVVTGQDPAAAFINAVATSAFSEVSKQMGSTGLPPQVQNVAVAAAVASLRGQDITQATLNAALKEAIKTTADYADKALGLGGLTPEQISAAYRDASRRLDVPQTAIPAQQVDAAVSTIIAENELPSLPPPQETVADAGSAPSLPQGIDANFKLVPDMPGEVADAILGTTAPTEGPQYAAVDSGVVSDAGAQGGNPLQNLRPNETASAPITTLEDGVPITRTVITGQRADGSTYEYTVVHDSEDGSYTFETASSDGNGNTTVVSSRTPPAVDADATLVGGASGTTPPETDTERVDRAFESFLDAGIDPDMALKLAMENITGGSGAGGADFSGAPATSAPGETLPDFSEFGAVPAPEETLPDFSEFGAVPGPLPSGATQELLTSADAYPQAESTDITGAEPTSDITPSGATDATLTGTVAATYPTSGSVLIVDQNGDLHVVNDSSGTLESGDTVTLPQPESGTIDGGGLDALIPGGGTIPLDGITGGNDTSYGTTPLDGITGGNDTSYGTTTGGGLDALAPSGGTTLGGGTTPLDGLTGGNDTSYGTIPLDGITGGNDTSYGTTTEGAVDDSTLPPLSELPVVDIESQPVTEVTVDEPLSELPVVDIESQPVTEVTVDEPLSDLPAIDIGSQPVVEVTVDTPTGGGTGGTTGGGSTGGGTTGGGGGTGGGGTGGGGTGGGGTTSGALPTSKYADQSVLPGGGLLHVGKMGFDMPERKLKQLYENVVAPPSSIGSYQYVDDTNPEFVDVLKRETLPFSSYMQPGYAQGGLVQAFADGGQPDQSYAIQDSLAALKKLGSLGFEGRPARPQLLQQGQMGGTYTPKVLPQLAALLRARGMSLAEGGQPDDRAHPNYDGVPLLRTGGLSGMGGKYVEGKGDGTSDDIAAMLADGEYVFSADVVAALGNGSNKAGAEELDKMVQAIRARARSAPPDKLPPDAKSPLEYLKSSKGKKHG